MLTRTAGVVLVLSTAFMFTGCGSGSPEETSDTPSTSDGSDSAEETTAPADGDTDPNCVALEKFLTDSLAGSSTDAGDGETSVSAAGVDLEALPPEVAEVVDEAGEMYDAAARGEVDSEKAAAVFERMDVVYGWLVTNCPDSARRVMEGG